MTVIKINLKGTCKKVDDVYFSYKIQITANYKGYTLFNNRFYSMITSEHQYLIRNFVGHDTIDLQYADFNEGIEWSIKHEIECLEQNIEQLKSKRKTKKCLDKIDKYTNKIVMLQELLNK